MPEREKDQQRREDQKPHPIEREQRGGREQRDDRDHDRVIEEAERHRQIPKKEGQ